MFFRVLILALIIVFVTLWSDYIKVLIYLEFLSLVFLTVIMLGIKLDYLSLNFFFGCLIFLVCESRLGFLLFILYIRIESDLVKKINLVQL
jgi:hypothetical protein